MSALTFVAALCAATSSTPTVQPSVLDKPDFSGSWVLESGQPSAEDIPCALSVLQPVTRTNVRGEPIGPFFLDITITRSLQSGSRTETHKIGVVGGVVPGIVAGASSSEPPKPHLHFRVGWEGESLVFETGSYTGEYPGTGAWTERRETWTLDSTGRLHVEDATRGSTETEKTVSFVYRREQQ